MKIIIIGAGLSGLSTAIAMRKYLAPVLSTTSAPLTVHIYDRAATSSSGDDAAGYNDHADIRDKKQGAVISLQSNALRVLADFAPALAARVALAGFPCRGFTWRTAEGWWLGRDVLEVLPVSRPALVGCLADEVKGGGEGDEVVVVRWRTVREVVCGGGSGGGRPRVEFVDGGWEEADLVVGADGVGSVVRGCLFGGGEGKGEGVSGGERYRARYHGMCAVGGVLDLTLPTSYLADPTIMFFEGPTGFFCWCGLSQTSNKVLYSSIYDAAELPARGAQLDHRAINAYIRERHATFADPVVQQCLDKAVVDNIYPIFWVPDLPHWGRDGVVLVGDAAHAMPPASGQGGSQAFEDAQTLALLLAGVVRRADGGEEDSQLIACAIDAFYQLRHGHVDAMKAKAISLREPQRPWSRLTTLLVYVGISMFVNVKFCLNWLGVTGKDTALTWDPKVKVEAFLQGLEK